MAGTLVRRLLTSRVGCPLRQYCSPAATTTPSAGGGQSQPANVTQEGEAGSEDQIFSKVDIELRAHQPDVLESYNWFATTAARHLNVDVASAHCDKEPHKLRKTLLKSAHIYSKHRVQYEIRTYYSFINLKNLTGSTMLTYLEYIQRNLPEGVAMKVTKHERKSFVKLGK